ncbi:MAG: sodium-translocating pyrophosphatase [bacterium]
MEKVLLWFAPIVAALALFFALRLYFWMMKKPEGSEKMKEIASAVREGAMAYVKQQYKVVSIFFGIAFVLFFTMSRIGLLNPVIPFAFLTGGFFSGLAGYLGMIVATRASSRTAQGCLDSLNEGLAVSFRSGAIMGLIVTGFGLLDISVWFLLLKYVGPAVGLEYSLAEITMTMLSFGMGASLQALFARVGGGIFTKAADVGADLVGKVEAGIPEDDPRNPATIADNVGDNVGDVAGMGADLYESYCGSILSSMALGAVIGIGQEHSFNAVLLPMLISGLGIVFSLIGIFMVRGKSSATQKELLWAINKGVYFASIMILLSSAGLIYWLLPDNMGYWVSILVGLVVGIVVGKSTEYYTSEDYSPTKGVANSAKMGPATTIIDGYAVGSMSVWIPILTISVGIIVSYWMGGGGANPTSGFYSIALSGVGMLSTLSIIFATDAYGPIADNAGGNAQMSGLDLDVRKRTDMLDSLGNTTAAIGKGYAIGSGFLTALALLVSYLEEAKMNLLLNNVEKIGDIFVKDATMAQLVNHFNINILNPKMLVGTFIGGTVVFLFAALTLKAVGKSANYMVEEVRRQFKEIDGIMEGTAKPDYQACVKIATKGAQKEMILPALIGFLAPAIVGPAIGIAGVMGYLLGVITTGLLTAILMSNAGGAWDNAKKYIEAGSHGGKGSEAHKAAVVGDTVGDPFKDTTGPSLNILIKLSAMSSIIFVGLALLNG